MPVISPAIKGYLVAVLGTVVVLIVRLAIADTLEDRAPFLLPMIVAVFLAAWIGGLKPGLLATLLGVVLGTALLREPTGEGSSWLRSEVPIAMFFVEGLAISGSFEAMHKSRRRLENKQRQLEAENRKRRQVEQELVTADRRKNEFLATLAHELRNPLAPIRYSLEILNRAHDDSALQETTRAVIGRQVRQMVRLVDDLLDMSRITRNKLELRKERVDVAMVLRSAVETSRPLIEAAGQKLTISLLSEPLLVDADPVRLAQVFSNLLNNAAKYTERKGQIDLTVERAGAEVVVKVRDSGIGIPADMLAQIFEMFTQVDGHSGRARGGLGIGLSLVKWLTEMHGGCVKARSDGPGKGSEFVVRLPCAASSPASERQQRTDGVAPAAAVKGWRVLVVDDNDDSLSSLAKMLVLLGNQVHTAQDGREAVAAAASFRPDLVLLDLGMPGMDGYEAARQIRTEAWGKKMVLVAHTGWGQEETRRRTQEAGFDFHLTKPAAPQELESLLAGLSARPAPGRLP